MEFKILKKSKKSRARLGLLKTPHGVVETPALVVVATQAAVKALTFEEVKKTKTQILISNAYHLHLRPGEKMVEKSGGLHKFMNWDKPLMTDSGGYQVFSLGFGADYKMGKIITEVRSKNQELSIKLGHQPKSLKITKDGVRFRSYVDGQEIFMTPKESMKIQKALGGDIIFAFDECTPPIADYDYTKKSMETTHRWAKECLAAFRNKEVRNKNNRQALYGIVQGGKFKDLRVESAKFIGSLPFDGFGIGGELGFNKKTMFKMLDWVMEVLPEGKPRHLLGNGHLEDMEKIFKSGVDTVDCIVPTHYARHGIAFTSQGRLDLNKKELLNDKKPVDKNCDCYVCQTYSRSYLSHLFRAREIAPLSLLTFHNLYFFNSFVEKIRERIKREII
ncbi:MAG: tRNA guanosine(34) transglycosylase Tgt [Candidatus Wolfebacteria bacterium]|nr:tRNA guanosine(34) transglycosylase Tgt [Candidatus Wolfebacteria bacterium]